VATYASAAPDGRFGDPTRQAIVERLAAGPLAVSELAAQLPISRPAVSQHLKVLAEGGFWSGTAPVGTRRVYHLDVPAIEAVRVYLDGFWHGAMSSFAALAEDTAPADPPLYPPEPPDSPESLRPFRTT